MTAFGTHRVTLDTTVLTNVSESRISRREKPLALDNSGNLHISQRTLMRASPVIEFATGDIKVLLAKLSLLESPAWVAAGAGITVITPQAGTAGPGWASGSNHVLHTIASGMVLLDRLSWASDGMAVANCSVLAKSADGTTDPAPATATTAPAQGAVGTEFVLQSLTIGGTAVTDCTRFELTCQHQTTNEAPACFNLGLPYPTAILGAGAMGAAAFELTIECLNAITSFSNGAIVAVFKNKTANALALGSDTVTVTLNTCLVTAGDHVSGAPGSRTIKCLATHDGTNRPLTVATA